MSNLKIGDWVRGVNSGRIGPILSFPEPYRAEVHYVKRRAGDDYYNLGIFEIPLNHLIKICPNCKQSNCPGLGV